VEEIKKTERCTLNETPSTFTPPNSQVKQEDDVVSVTSRISSVVTTVSTSEEKSRKQVGNGVDHGQDWNSSTKLNDSSKSRIITITSDNEIAENLAKIHSKASLGQMVSNKATVSIDNYFSHKVLRRMWCQL